MRTDGGSGGRRGGRVLALAAGAVGLVLVAVAVLTQQPDAPRLDEPRGELESESPSAPPSSGPTTEPSESPATPPRVTSARETPLGPSTPRRVRIPSIGVDSEVIRLGKNPDGTLAVPQPGPDLDKAAWFENSPTPGQPGPSVVEGHVATDEGGPSIFFDLAELRPGDTIQVDREDGRTAVFEVDALREFPKDEFPTDLVYGGDLSRPTLRLITCSNFDSSVGGHTSNLIVFSHLAEVRGGPDG